VLLLLMLMLLLLMLLMLLLFVALHNSHLLRLLDYLCDLIDSFVVAAGSADRLGEVKQHCPWPAGNFT
jgi:hypothetical protein